MRKNATEILNEASRIITGSRAKDYGPASENFNNIARLWEPIIGVRLTPTQVALCMVQVKVSRLIHTPDHEDSVVDIAGYAALIGELGEKGERE